MVAYASLSRGRLLADGLALALSLPAFVRSRGTKTLLRRFAVAPLTIPRVKRVTTIPLNIAPIRSELASAAASRNLTLLLRLGAMRVARPPGAIWRVYLAPPGTPPSMRKEYIVGNVGLFSDGVGAGARPAAREFVIDKAVRRSLPLARNVLELGFIPTGPLINGQPTSPVPEAALHIGELSMWVRRL